LATCCISAEWLDGLTMTSTKLSILAVVLACTALLYSFLNAPTAVRATEEGLSVAFQDPEQKAAMADFVQRMSILERRLGELRLMNAEGPNTHRQSGSESATDVQALLSRLQAVERVLLEIKATQYSARSGGDRFDLAQSIDATAASLLTEEQGGAEELEGMVAGWTATALDRSSSESVRIDALGGLRGNHLLDGTDARVPVIAEMILMAQSSLSGRVRANVWQQMRGVTDSDLMSALIHALANDVYQDAREQAAESLGSFLPDSAVESALRYAMEFDADKGVRDQAKKSLSMH
jgi:hypothetical protein